MFLAFAFWRAATSFTVMDVRASTKEAKQAAYVAMLHHNLVYMVFYRLVKIKESMISKDFAAKLAAAKTDAQLDALVEEIATHFPNRKSNEWSIPNLEDMEVEAMHLITYWKDKRVSFGPV